MGYGGAEPARERINLRLLSKSLARAPPPSARRVMRRSRARRMILSWARKKEYRADVPELEYAKVRQRKGVALKPEQVRALTRSFDDEQARVAFPDLHHDRAARE
jgi:uncharacterized sporulation protein YeaH/YhbH (DUF444 family)